MTTETTRTAPTRREYEALRAILDEIKSSGCAPTRGRIAQIMGTPSSSLSRILDGLEAKGLARAAYDAGPWMPLRGLDGQPVKVRAVVEVEASP